MLIPAWEASALRSLDQGREVYTQPHNPHFHSGHGTNIMQLVQELSALSGVQTGDSSMGGYKKRG